MKELTPEMLAALCEARECDHVVMITGKDQEGGDFHAAVHFMCSPEFMPRALAVHFDATKAASANMKTEVGEDETKH